MDKKAGVTFLFVCRLLWPPLVAHAQPTTTIREYSQSFPTYPYSDPSPIPLLNNVYPYFRYDGFTDKPINKNWKVVELQNQYIRLLILPEIGGKVWAAIERSTGRPFLYYNHSVKFRDIAMRGPWTSGGLEANYGIIGHTPNCATPVDYTTRVNEDGSVSCIIGTLDLLSRSYWRMEINLPKDQALFRTRSFWYNTTPLEQPYYHWMNAGLPAAGDLEFIYPGNRYLGHEGEYADWPINRSNGKNISWYKQNDFGGPKSYHVFGKYTDFSGAYWHDYDFGMVRYGTHDEKAGKKLWIWGLSRQGMIWERLLTDTDGQYIELQSGRLFNQNAEGSSLTPFKHRAFMPYGTDTWEEDWYPVVGTKGFVKAGPDGAINILNEGGWLKIFFSPVRSFQDTLILTVGNKVIYNKAVSFSPLHIFRDSLPYGPPSSPATPLPTGLVARLTDRRFVYDASPAADTLSRPVDAPADFNWNSAYAQCLKASEAIDQRNYPEAEEALRRSLNFDHNYAPALIKMAELLYRNLRYKEALVYAMRALSIATEDGAANFIYGLINEELGQSTDARDGYDIATLDPAYRSAADTRLARIYAKEKDWQRAWIYAIKALAGNPANMEALQIQAVCERYQRKGGSGAESPLAAISRLDPLNHFARLEQYFQQPTPVNKTRFLSLIRNELPQETFLELGLWYYSLGLPEEALTVLRMSPTCAETRLWIAHLSNQSVDWKSIDPVRSFPFRAETARLLEEMLTANDHWLLKYQLALIYHSRNRFAECKQLLAACGDTPDFAPFYAFRAVMDTFPAIASSVPASAAAPFSGATGRPEALRDLQRAAS
ncbi:MAG TPA: DUF5107 domain-containing protein, partial [Puia sp.]|nr:DUF5107 domain-containing protein [Puia sp.]